ncbi:uncharacterized protein [Nicotiana sylvestris]|uniref:uncharacterized protein n=1 Tax=Nicotiana sylvestris TaxID=4096 RepID=UPI00388CE2F7
MKKDIVEYVARCLNCQQVKYEHQWPVGLLQKLEIPELKWEQIAMDFMVGPPRTQGKFDVAWVIVDTLTKSAHFIPVMTTYSSEQVAQVYIREIITLHGMSDRLRIPQSRQKSYADRKVHDVAFVLRERVLLRVSSMKGVMRFRKKGKLSPRFIGPLEVLQRVGEVAYELTLPHSLAGVHPVFHISILRKYHGDPSHVLDFSSVQ